MVHTGEVSPCPIIATRAAGASSCARRRAPHPAAAHLAVATFQYRVCPLTRTCAQLCRSCCCAPHRSSVDAGAIGHVGCRERPVRRAQGRALEAGAAARHSQPLHNLLPHLQRQRDAGVNSELQCVKLLQQMRTSRSRGSGSGGGEGCVLTCLCTPRPVLEPAGPPLGLLPQSTCSRQHKQALLMYPNSLRMSPQQHAAAAPWTCTLWGTPLAPGRPPGTPHRQAGSPRAQPARAPAPRRPPAAAPRPVPDVGSWLAAWHGTVSTETQQTQGASEAGYAQGIVDPDQPFSDPSARNSTN